MRLHKVDPTELYSVRRDHIFIRGNVDIYTLPEPPVLSPSPSHKRSMKEDSIRGVEIEELVEDL